MAEPIRVKIGVGIAGYVAQSGESERIDDAQNDRRFNKENDKRNNYFTESILAVPIKDYDGAIVGVC